jgi:hypothetical protein
LSATVRSLLIRRQIGWPPVVTRARYHVGYETSGGAAAIVNHFCFAKACFSIMDAQALIWFGLSGGTAIFGLSLLYQRFVQKQPRAVQAGASYPMFALLMLFFALGALAAGLISA